MALQSIDVQAMFSQLDKVGKEQAAQRDGAALQKALAGDREAHKLTERLESVNAAADGGSPDNPGGEGLERLEDRDMRGNPGQKQPVRRKKKEPAADPSSKTVINDPMIGGYIDLEG
jgi:hypothetical protein